MPGEVEGAWLSDWRLAKAAWLSAVLVSVSFSCISPQAGEPWLQCLIIEGYVSAWPEYRCCWLLDRSFAQ